MFDKYKDALVNNSFIVNESFTSSSYDKNTAEIYKQNIFYIIKSKTGKNIEKASRYGESNPDMDVDSYEYEVLFKAGTKFRVVSVNNKTGEIEIEEL